MDKLKANGEMSFAPLLERYFLSYLMRQKVVSPETIGAYRDSFKLYFGFLDKRYGIKCENVGIRHFNADYIMAFGLFLEEERHNKAVTVNLRLSAIKTFLRYASLECPEYSGTIRKSLSIPERKTDKKVLCFLTREEYQAMMDSCDSCTRLGFRDKTMILVLYNTGCRVSEMVNLTVADVHNLDRPGNSFIRFFGKGRKERLTPIWKTTATFLKDYIRKEHLSGHDRLFKGNHDECLTRSGVGQRISLVAAKASEDCLSLRTKNVTPHTFRHTAAMNLLHSKVDISTIAIWLGHESIETTHKYMVADLDTKRRAQEMLHEPCERLDTYKPSRQLLDFLDSL